MTEKFDPTKYAREIPRKNNKTGVTTYEKYLDVKWRIRWFRDEYPDWTINTQIIQLDPYVVMRAEVINPDGRLVASSHGMAKDTGNNVWSGRAVEKGETAAIGRALALAGFGTQFAEGFDTDDDELSDSPVERPKSSQNSPSKPSNGAKGKSTHNGAQNGSQTANPPDGTIDHVLLKEVRVYVKDPETKHRYEFTTEDGRKVYEFSRDKFKELGWIEDAEWNELGTFAIKHAIPVAAKFNATDTGGWWNVETVAEVTF